MNKLYKCALGLFTTFILSFACYSNAIDLPTATRRQTGNYVYNGLFDYIMDKVDFGTTPTEVNIDNDIDFVCFKGYYGNSAAYNLEYSINGGTWYNVFSSEIGCTDQKTIYFKGGSVIFFYFLEGDGYVPEQYDSLQCQTEYNLIPISEVTANYCALNFGMIDPQECPINSGTGTIVRSNLMINDIPYAQNQNINVFIPDFLAWNIAFNDFNTVIEVEGYNADEEYIENIINQEKITPTNKDIEDMLTGFMTNYFPYLALTIVFLYLARKIFKLFK